jgi:phosphoglycerol transferase
VNQFFLLIVSLLTVASVVFLRRSSRASEAVLGFLAVFVLGVGTVFFFVAHWFTGQGIDDSVIFHVRHGVQGAGMDDYSGLIAWSIFGILLSLLFAFLAAWKLRRHRDSSHRKPRLVFLLVLCAAILVHPVTVGFVGSQGSPLWMAFSADRDDFANYYRSPGLRAPGKNPKNLVLVFMESFERSYFDESVFPGLIKGLKELEREGVSFTQIEQLPGTGWTIGGMTASLCGLPLFTASHGNSMTGTEAFLPGATCMGDLLAEEGVSLTYLSGSSLEFAGTRKLFESHGFERVVGLEQLHDLVTVDAEGWGVQDDVLFERAVSEIEKSRAQEKPFALFISTIDTHPPGGRLSAACSRRSYASGDNEILNSLACSDEVITEFARRVLGGPQGEDTVLVLMSDHLAMANSASNQLERTDRKNLFLILNAGREGEVIHRPGSQLDIGPTLLSAMGYEADLGLGRNLLGGEASVSELVPDLQNGIVGWYRNITQFWGFPRLEEGDQIVVDPDTGQVRISDLEYQFPLLMEFDQDGKTTIRFDSPHEGFRLFDFLANMNPRVPFLWVDHCESVGKLLDGPGQGTCMVYGHSASRQLVREHLSSRKVLDLDSFIPLSKQLNPVRSGKEVANQARDHQRIIAHAGGMVGGRIYTNTLEALDQNYAKGFRLFELDILETTDGHFVAAHDWAFWRQLTGFAEETPPTLDEFRNAPILEHLTPLDMERINRWFDRHPDAILVTDKVNKPAAFAARFVDRNRLVMELFSVPAVKEGIDAGIRSAMPSEAVVRSLGGEAARVLQGMGVTDVALSRRLINTNGALLDSLEKAGIRVYVFHVNRTETRDEAFALCSDLDFVYGFYADAYDFADPPPCKGVRTSLYPD